MDNTDNKSPSIRKLPSQLINQIAAGEVIERPASAVKELIENAIDAKASHIDVEIRSGGKAMIRVSDDGFGIRKNELLIAIDRHATSKLADNNLDHINTMGFRGEALPSMAAISRFSIISRHKDINETWKLEVDKTQKNISPNANINGTTVLLRDLFYNTPARLKFLNSDKSETIKVIDTCQKLAMAQPFISFTLRADKRNVLNLNAPKNLDVLKNKEQAFIDAAKERMKSIAGQEFIANHIKTRAEEENVKLTIFATIPSFNRSSARYIYTFVNRRPVNSKLIAAAIRLAYKDFIPHNRYPVIVLYIDIEPQDIDINVHPAKSEVKFRYAAKMRSFITNKIRASIGNYDSGSHFTPMDSFHKKSYVTQKPSFRQQSLRETSLGETNLGKTNLGKQNPYYPQFGNDTNIDDNQELNEELPLGSARCQIYDTYIIAQSSDGLVIVDQHAADERILYEALKKQIFAKKVIRQALLIPEIIRLEKSAMETLLQQQQNLADWGIVLEAFDDDSVMVREIPEMLEKKNIKDMIEKLAEHIIDETKDIEFSVKENIAKICSVMSCHGSIRAGRKLSLEEMNMLLRNIEKTPFSDQCNHGRPTYIKCDKNQLEKLFSRK